MNVRSMNEPEDCPSMLLKLTYPEDYPEASPLQIEYDDESDDYEAEDYSELDVVLKEVVSVSSLEMFLLKISFRKNYHILKLTFLFSVDGRKSRYCSYISCDFCGH